MKIYINGIRFENTAGRLIRAENLCEIAGIPKENAIVSDEDHNEIPFDSHTFYVNDKDIFYIVRRFVTGN